MTETLPRPAQRRLFAAYSALVLGAAAMGLSPIFVRLAEVGPYASAFWRAALATPFLYVWMRFENKTRASIAPDRMSVLVGMLFAGDLFFWHLAILNTSVANATFFATTAPISVAIAAWLLFRERIGPRVLAGLILCILGGSALLGQTYGYAPERLSGDAFGLVTSVFFGLYVLAARVARDSCSAAELTFRSTFVTAIILFVIAIFLEPTLLPKTATGVLALMALALISQVAGQGLLIVALGTLPATFSALVLFLEAIAAAAFGWLILGEALSLVQALGGLLICAGIWIARPDPDTMERRDAVAMPSDRFAFLKALFDEAVTLAHPKTCLPPHLPPPPAHGRLIILAAGKAAGAMVEVAEQHYLQTLRLDPARLSGIGVTRHGYARPTRVIPVIEAGHPVPDQAGFKATEQTLALADSATRDDLILVLISGGASANWIAPANGVSFEDKQAVNRALLRSGAAIDDINTVRKHLSRIKGGRLAARAHPAQIVTLAMSDVPGDDPAIIGSGPSVPDPSTLADARAIVARFQLDLPDSVVRALNDPANETPKPGDPAFAASEFHLVVRPADIFPPIERRLRAAGYDVIFLGDRVEGEARDVAALHAAMAIELARADKRTCIISGGELTVSIKGTGRGGPNQEYALALALAIEGEGGIAALSADTDGTDGGGGDPSDPAGACVDHETIAKARGLGLDPAAFLDNNDSTGFFNRVGDLLLTGPTMTNVNDFRAIVVDKHRSVRA